MDYGIAYLKTNLPNRRIYSEEKGGAFRGFLNAPPPKSEIDPFWREQPTTGADLAHSCSNGTHRNPLLSLVPDDDSWTLITGVSRIRTKLCSPA